MELQLMDQFAMVYRLELLGGFHFAAPDGAEIQLGPVRLRALVAAIALAEGRAVPRSRLWDLLWEDSTEQRARNNLRQSFTALRSACRGSKGFPFRVSRDEAAILPDAIEVDALKLEAALKAADPLATGTIGRGLFLEGLHLPGAVAQDWLLSERQRWESLRLRHLEHGMTACDAAGRLDEAAVWAEWLIAADPAAEAAHRTLIRVHLAHGDRARALRQFEDCRTSLETRLGVRPDSETTSLRDRILSEDQGAAVLTEGPSVVVLPFDNLSGDPAQDYFCDSLTETLTSNLARFSDLSVIASRSAFHLRSGAASIPEVCRAFGVGYAVTGGAQRIAHGIRVVVSLVSAIGRIAWTQQYERETEAVDDLHAEVAEVIASTLAAGYGGQLRRAWSKARRSVRPSEAGAFDLFTRALETVDRWTPADLTEGRELFRQAVALDEGYGRAWAKLSFCYLIEAAEGWSDDFASTLAEASRLARHAVAVDPSEPWSHWALGACEVFSGHHDAGIAEIERALGFNPGDADIMTDHGYFLSLAGRAEEGLAVAKRAMTLNPYFPDWYLLQLMQIEFDACRYRDALATASRIRLSATTANWLYLAASHAALGQIPSAKAAARTAVQLDSRSVRKKLSDPRLLPYRREEDRRHLYDNLALAGLRQAFPARS
jgi:TolB-like protein